MQRGPSAVGQNPNLGERRQKSSAQPVPVLVACTLGQEDFRLCSQEVWMRALENILFSKETIEDGGYQAYEKNEPTGEGCLYFCLFRCQIPKQNFSKQFHSCLQNSESKISSDSS